MMHIEEKVEELAERLKVNKSDLGVLFASFSTSLHAITGEEPLDGDDTEAVSHLMKLVLDHFHAND